MGDEPSEIPEEPVGELSGADAVAPEPTPTYQKPRFVGGMVVLAVLLGLAIYYFGNSGNVVLTPEGEVAPRRPAAESGSFAAPEAGRREDCPDPGEPVEFEAAELVQLFAASATGGGFASLAATPEVQDQIAASGPSPPVNRMTRIRGWVESGGEWSTCVLSSWVGPSGAMQSIDIVTAGIVAGKDRSDAEPDDDDRDRRNSRDSRELEDRWEIMSWLRGLPETPPSTHSATVSFYNSKRSCKRPDRPASVPVADGDPSERLLAALEELVSGTPGRANSATTKVPADIQVIEATVADGRARVVLSATRDELSKCDGTAAFEQVRDTAAAVGAETMPPFGDDDREVEVEVIVEGDRVDTLRR